MARRRGRARGVPRPAMARLPSGKRVPLASLRKPSRSEMRRVPTAGGGTRLAPDLRVIRETKLSGSLEKAISRGEITREEAVFLQTGGKYGQPPTLPKPKEKTDIKELALAIQRGELTEREAYKRLAFEQTRFQVEKRKQTLAEELAKQKKRFLPEQLTTAQALRLIESKEERAKLTQIQREELGLIEPQILQLSQKQQEQLRKDMEEERKEIIPSVSATTPSGEPYPSIVPIPPIKEELPPIKMIREAEVDIPLKEQLFGEVGLFKRPLEFLKLRGLTSRRTGELTERGKEFFGSGISYVGMGVTGLPYTAITFGAIDIATEKAERQRQILLGQEESFVITKAQEEAQKRFEQQFTPIEAARKEQFEQLQKQFEEGLITTKPFEEAKFKLEPTEEGFRVIDPYLQEQQKRISESIEISEKEYKEFSRQFQQTLTPTQRFKTSPLYPTVVGLGAGIVTGVGLVGTRRGVTALERALFPRRTYPRDIVIPRGRGFFEERIQLPKGVLKDIEIAGRGRLAQIESFEIQAKKDKEILNLILKDIEGKPSRAKVELPSGTAQAKTIKELLITMPKEERMLLQREITGRGLGRGIAGRYAGAEVDLRIQEFLFRTRQGGFLGLTRQQLRAGAYPKEVTRGFVEIPTGADIIGTKQIPIDVLIGQQIPFRIEKGAYQVALTESQFKQMFPKVKKPKIDRGFLAMRKQLEQQTKGFEILPEKEIKYLTPKQYAKYLEGLGQLKVKEVKGVIGSTIKKDFLTVGKVVFKQPRIMYLSKGIKPKIDYLRQFKPLDAIREAKRMGFPFGKKLLTHELLHVRYPFLSEKQIQQMQNLYSKEGFKIIVAAEPKYPKDLGKDPFRYIFKEFEKPPKEYDPFAIKPIKGKKGMFRLRGFETEFISRQQLEGQARQLIPKGKIRFPTAQIVLPKQAQFFFPLLSSKQLLRQQQLEQQRFITGQRLFMGEIVSPKQPQVLRFSLKQPVIERERQFLEQIQRQVQQQALLYSYPTFPPTQLRPFPLAPFRLRLGRAYGFPKKAKGLPTKGIGAYIPSLVAAEFGAIFESEKQLKQTIKQPFFTGLGIRPLLRVRKRKKTKRKKKRKR